MRERLPLRERIAAERTAAAASQRRFIGLEAAAALRHRQVAVHVVAPETRPMERVLGPAMGNFIRSLHESHGVVFHLGRTVAAIGAQRVQLDDGSAIEAELVLVGIGVRPRVALAERAGFAADRGVLVNEYLETSTPGVFAAGDIARWPDAHSGDRLRIEHWVIAERQGQTAARNMLGRRERFAAVPFFWTQQYDVSIDYVGHATARDRIDAHGDPGARDVTLHFLRGDRIVAVSTIFRGRESLEAVLAMEQDRSPSARSSWSHRSRVRLRCRVLPAGERRHAREAARYGPPARPFGVPSDPSGARAATAPAREPRR